MKRTVSIVLALMMVLGMATMGISVASAAETNTVTFTSNIGANGTIDYVPGTTEKVTVCYDLTSTYGIINIQGKVNYDPTVLKIANTDVLPNLTNLSTSINTTLSDHVSFNASGFNPVDFSTKATLVKVVFDVIGSGDTTVNLVVDYMTGNTGASSTTAATDVDLVADGTADTTKMTTAAAAEVYPEEQLVDPSVFLVQYGSYLAGEVSLQTYFYKAPKGYDASTLSVKFSGPDRLTAENVTIPYTQLTSMNKLMSYHNYKLYSAMLNEPVTWEVIQNGKTIAKQTYSIEQYVVDKLPATETSNPKLAQLYKALLNFGAMAQLKFNYNTDNLANARINYAAPTVTAADIVLPAEVSSTHPSISAIGANYLAAGNEYLAATNMQLAYKVTNATNFNNNKANITVTDPKGKTSTAEFTAAGSNAILGIKGVASPYLDAVYTITYPNGVSFKTTVLADIKNKLTSNPDDKFFQAVYLYNQAANANFGV